MAVTKELKVKGFIVRNGKKMNRDDLTIEEQRRLAAEWNQIAMEAAGYTSMPKAQ